MRRLSGLLGLAGVLMLAGCVVVHEHSHSSEPVVVQYTDCTAVIYREYYDCDADTVAFLVGTKLDPLDLFVLLAIAHHTHQDIHAVVSYHYQHRDLSKVAAHYKCKPDVFVSFVPGTARVASGPPYGRAYGYYKKHGHVDTLSHAELRDWMELRLMVDYYHQDPDDAIRWKESGKTFRDFSVQHYQESGRGKNIKGGAVVKKDRPWDSPGKEPAARKADEHPGKGHGDKHENKNEKHIEKHEEKHERHVEKKNDQAEKDKDHADDMTPGEKSDDAADKEKDKDSGKDKNKDKKKGKSKKGQDD